MKTIRLGNSGVTVSALCLGTMYFGSSTGQQLSYRLLDQYVDAGGAFLDTANMYAQWVPGSEGGDSEKLLGSWMRERGNRSRMFVASKVGVAMRGVEKGLKAKQIEAECEKSLKRLGVDTIDLYYAHADDRNTPLEETMEGFTRLIGSGKVRCIGASNYVAWRMEEAYGISMTRQFAQFCCIQQRYSYFRPAAGAVIDLPEVAANEEMFDYCRTRNIAVLAYSPLMGGAYSRPDKPLPKKYAGTHNQARLRVLQELANEKRASINQIVLAWMCHSQPSIIPVIGVSTTEQMAENLGALKVSLSSEEMEWLNDA